MGDANRTRTADRSHLEGMNLNRLQFYDWVHPTFTFRRTRTVFKACAFCLDLFEPKRQNHQFCSYYCENRFFRERGRNESNARRHQDYYQRHSEIRQKTNTYIRERTQKARISALQALGAKCARCGFEDFRALQIDHVQGGGRKEYKSINFSSTRAIYYEGIAANPEPKKYQLLCANCNWIKRSIRKETGAVKAAETIPDWLAESPAVRRVQVLPGAPEPREDVRGAPLRDS